MLLKTTGKEYGEPLPKQTDENREKKTARKMYGCNIKAVKTHRQTWRLRDSESIADQFKSLLSLIEIEKV